MDTVDERSWKQKWEDLKWKAEQKKMDAIRWCNEHPQGAFLVASTALGAGSYAGRKIFKRVEINKELKLLECRHYDRRTDEYWFSRRPLKTSEKLKLDKMYTAGYSKGEILQQMGLLK